MLFIINNVIYEFSRIDFEKVFNLTTNTVIISLISSLIIVIIAVYFQFLKRIFKNRTITFFNEVISLTYALPGAVIGLSLILLFTSYPFENELLIGSFGMMILHLI